MANRPLMLLKVQPLYFIDLLGCFSAKEAFCIVLFIFLTSLNMGCDEEKAPSISFKDDSDAAGKRTHQIQPDGSHWPVLSPANVEFDICAEDTIEAEEVPVDIYMMIDRSGSMDIMTEDNTTKWNAIRSAISSFIEDSDSDGIGVGLQFFPLVDQPVIESCTSDSDCGPHGPCMLRACEKEFSESGYFVFCSDSGDCEGANNLCAEIGYCSDAPYENCMDSAFDSCQGWNLGYCVPLEESTCLNHTSCDQADYSEPSVPIMELPNKADTLIDSLMNVEPEGATPTAPALLGAIEYAHSHAKAHIERHAVAVLATDGYPTACEPIDILGISEIAASGMKRTPHIPTYVIGIFSPTEDTVKDDLDTIAESGGTDEAIIVYPNSDLSDLFGDALDEIRRKSLACAFQIPESDNDSLDFHKINVLLRSSSSKQELIYVSSPENCQQTQLTGSNDVLGWYYDVNPEYGATPSKIVTCPQTCELLQDARDGKVEILIGCETLGLEHPAPVSDEDDAGRE